MSIIVIIFQPILSFVLVVSFSMFFMCLFFIAGVLSTKIDRNIIDETDEMKHLNGYMTAAIAGLIAGSISLITMVFIK